MAEVMRVREITVRQLARSAGASPSHVSRVLRGAQGKRPSLALLERLAEALSVPPDFFMEVRRSRAFAELERDSTLVDEVLDRHQ